MRRHRDRPADRSRSWRAVLGLTAAALLVLAGVLALGWRWAGGNWLIVATPSMGTTAPVGSLVVTRATRVEQVRVGDIVSYHPPAGPRETITHRVVDITGGVLRTRGDINGAADPWKLHTCDLVGRVVSIWPGLGWLLKAVPILVFGGFLVWLATRFWATARWRGPLRLFGSSLVVALAAVVEKPFVGMVLLTTLSDQGGTHAYLVSTGMLPVRVSAPDGSFLDLVDGQVGSLTTAAPAGPHGVPLTSHPHLSWTGWLILLLLWSIPLFCALLAGSSGPGSDRDGPAGDDPGPPTGPARPRRRRRRPAYAPGVVVAGLLAGLLATTGTSTAAALSAVVTNAADTAATGFFTCAAATGAVGASATVLTYPLADSTVTQSATAADTGGNARPGTYSAGFATTTSRPCPRDTTARAVTLSPTAAAPSYVYSSYKTTVTNTFTEVIWFRTTTTTGGRLIGWSTAQTGQSGVYDRHLYMTNSGQLIFGVYPSAVRTVTSPAAYNDGAWHQAAATLSPAGMVLYVDGAAVATDPTTVSGENSGGTVGGTPVETGYWRVGYDNLNAWVNVPTTAYWTGSLAWASVYGSALGAAQIRGLYAAGT